MHAFTSVRVPMNNTASSTPAARTGSLLSVPYPDATQWKELLEQFDSKAIAHNLLLSHIPYVFRNEPLKFALFRRTIGDAFDVEPTNVFIVGSAMAGRSLKGKAIDKLYSAKSDIDTLIVSEHLFAKYVMHSLDWVSQVTKKDEHAKNTFPGMTAENFLHIGRLSMNASRGIWRPDSLPRGADARENFFDRFSDVSLKTLGLQLSDDTVGRVNGRIARSFDDAANNLASSLRRLRWELESGTEGPDRSEDDEVAV
jgi:hypothetical protein